MPDQISQTPTHELDFEDLTLRTSRTHAFGLVIEGVVDRPADDYLHELLLTPERQAAFFDLIESERLIVCKNVRSAHPTYRRVRGKSSTSKLSQAEYYHHDGCSCPTKPRVVEIRLPHQTVSRQVATAIAPWADVIQAMLAALPAGLGGGMAELAEAKAAFAAERATWPAVEHWDAVQGKVTRLARKELDAESCRAYFRRVDQLANAYAVPWEMGESRLMLNNAADLSLTMQHRRAYQQPREDVGQNGSLVKRWPAEELSDAGVAIVTGE